MKTRLKWGDINALNARINEYFDKEPIPTIAGLCLHLDVSSEFWKYYISDKWQTKRKSDEEIEEIRKTNETIIENEGFIKIAILSPNISVIDDNQKPSLSETDSLKRQISDILKKTQLRIEDFTLRQVFSAKNPAGSIFYAKSALGYREIAQEGTATNQLPSKITIQIMPAPSMDQLIQPKIGMKVE